MSHDQINDEAIVTELDISHLVTEDETPVDNFQSEKQQRLLVEPLYSSWSPEPPFIAAANVGLFYALKQDPIVPDVMLSLGLEMPTDWSQKQNRSYFVWEFGKVPEVCIEIVSNREGDELTLSRKSQQKGKTATKKETYAHIGVPYYAVVTRQGVESEVRQPLASPPPRASKVQLRNRFSINFQSRQACDLSAFRIAAHPLTLTKAHPNFRAGEAATDCISAVVQRNATTLIDLALPTALLKMAIDAMQRPQVRLLRTMIRS